MKIIFDIILLLIIIVCSIFLGINIAKKDTSKIDAIIKACTKTIDDVSELENKYHKKLLAQITAYRLLLETAIKRLEDKEREIKELKSIKEEINQLKKVNDQ